MKRRVCYILFHAAVSESREIIMMKPALAITMGDINGVGPEILAKALAHRTASETFRPVVFGNAALLHWARRNVPNCPTPRAVASIDENVQPDEVAVLEGNMDAPIHTPGVVRADAGACAVEWLKQAIHAAQKGQVAGIVTCPLNKKGIQLAGYAYTGHTEILQEMFGVSEVWMSLFSDRMRIVHISTHHSMANALAFVQKERIIRAIRAGHAALLQLGLSRQRIAVAGLNPHAGESGILGHEETEEIAPAVAYSQAAGIDCHGPYSPDTIFRRMLLGEFDLVVAMHHDQGHIPFKLLEMDEGASVTLGLPVIRTSVDHGTAYDLAGAGNANEMSLCSAIRMAARFATNIL